MVQSIDRGFYKANSYAYELMEKGGSTDNNWFYISRLFAKYSL